MKRLLRRVWMWARICMSFTWFSPTTAFNISLSAAVDMAMFLLGRWHNLTTVFGGPYMHRQLGAAVYVRPMTEDMYYLMWRREGKIHDLFVSLVGEGDHVVDVGANVGYYTLLAASRGATVTALEPVPETAAVLMAVVRANKLEGRVRVVPACAWDRETSLGLVVPAGRDDGIATGFDRYEGKRVTVKCTRLDRLVREARLVKIDVEGAEYEALRGMEGIVDRVQHIILEVSRRPREIWETLRGWGFHVERIGRNHLHAYR